MAVESLFKSRKKKFKWKQGEGGSGGGYSRKTVGGSEERRVAHKSNVMPTILIIFSA